MVKLELPLAGLQASDYYRKVRCFRFLISVYQFGFCSIAELLGRHWHSRRVYDLVGRGAADYYDKKHPIHSGLRFDKKHTNAVRPHVSD